MSSEQWKEISKDQAVKYYVPAGDAIEQKRREEAERLANTTTGSAKNTSNSESQRKAKEQNDNLGESPLFPF